MVGKLPSESGRQFAQALRPDLITNCAARLDHVGGPTRPHSCHATVREAGCVAAGLANRAFAVDLGEEPPEDSEIITVGDLYDLLAGEPSLKCTAVYLPGYGRILTGHLNRVWRGTEIAAIIEEKD